MAESIQLYSAAGGHRWIQRLTAMLLSARHGLQELLRRVDDVLGREGES